MAKARMNVWIEFELDPDNYQDIEWPPGSGQSKDLVDPQEMVAWERSQIVSGDVDLYEWMDLAGVPDENITFELVSEQPVEIVNQNPQAGCGCGCGETF
jgi:hypothetical protein